MKSRNWGLGLAVWLFLTSCATPGDPPSTVDVAPKTTQRSTAEPAPTTTSSTADTRDRDQIVATEQVSVPFLPELSFPVLSVVSEEESRRMPYPEPPLVESTELDVPVDIAKDEPPGALTESVTPENPLPPPPSESTVVGEATVVGDATVVRDAPVIPESLPAPSVGGVPSAASAVSRDWGDSEEVSGLPERRRPVSTPMRGHSEDSEDSEERSVAKAEDDGVPFSAGTRENSGAGEPTSVRENAGAGEPTSVRENAGAGEPTSTRENAGAGEPPSAPMETAPLWDTEQPGDNVSPQMSQDRGPEPPVPATPPVEATTPVTATPAAPATSADLATPAAPATSADLATRAAPAARATSAAPATPSGPTSSVVEDSQIAPAITSAAPASVQAAPVESTENERTVAEGERIEVRLPGRSWLFLGSDAPVDFLGRSVSNDPSETVFAFRVIGESTLRFASQDVASGEQLQHRESIELSQRTVETVQRGEIVRSQGDASFSGQAVSPTETARDTDTRRSTLLEYLRDNTAPYDGVLHNELVETIQQEDRGNIDGDADNALMALSPETWIDYIQRIAAAGEVAASEQLLAILAEPARFADDEMIFRLAQLYETDTDVRDMRRARDLYRVIESEYPFSRYYNAASERIRFLNRHFFYIR